jgi:peptidoglycan/LPS O-acetylase OafA/YrhL
LSKQAALIPESPWIFHAIHHFVPPDWNTDEPGGEQFWQGIAAILIIWAFEAWPALQEPLCWPFLQYIGDLSFGIYVLHVIFVSCMDSSFLHPWFPGKDAETTIKALLWPQAFVTYFVSFWAADYFTRMDKKLVSWGYALQNRCFVKF